jgi:hypothetical protein
LQLPPNPIAANPTDNPNAANPRANPNVLFKIEILDIGKATPVTDRLLQVLQDVYNDSGKHTCHCGTTHIMVLYDNGKVIGGALLRMSNRVIILKRLCVGVENRNSIYSSRIIQYVISRYSTYEVHTTTTPESIAVFVANGFEQRTQSGLWKHRRRCKTIEITHPNLLENGRLYRVLDKNFYK